MNDANNDWRSPDFAWLAPAKLNLFLHVTGRRADGYHELQTIFQFIDYADKLRFTLRDDGKIRRLTDLPGVPEQNDLVVRAARSLQEASRTTLGADISVTKRLPMGGGLGGGSSDAATTLLALNKLWNTNLSNERLAEIGLALGADVPVFIRGEAAWAEGVGERLMAVDLLEPWYVVIKPNISVNTGEIFSDPQLTRTKHPIKIRDFLDRGTENVCEPVVRRRYPEVAEALDWLANYAPARLTGTGACVFASFDDKTSAARCKALVPPKWESILAKGMNKTPFKKLFA